MFLKLCPFKAVNGEAVALMLRNGRNGLSGLFLQIGEKFRRNTFRACNQPYLIASKGDNGEAVVLETRPLKRGAVAQRVIVPAAPHGQQIN